MPSGRVGTAKDTLFRSNEHFREAVTERENVDVSELETRLDRKLERAERARIGVTSLRRFLEQLLQRRWAKLLSSRACTHRHICDCGRVTCDWGIVESRA